MSLRLERQVLTDLTTIGDLYIDGAWLCRTLEDKFRNGPKVPGATAIPPGNYLLEIDFSNRFNRKMPHILSVPGFAGVRIHKGNNHLDTEGCILVGMESGLDRIWNCAPAFNYLYSRLDQKIRAGKIVYIKVGRSDDLQDNRTTDT